MEIIEPLRPHLHGQPQFPEHRAGVRDHDGAVLGPAFEPGPGRKQSRNDCGRGVQSGELPCHDRKLYVAIIIKRPLFTETAAAGVFVTALSISMTSTFCGQSWLLVTVPRHVVTWIFSVSFAIISLQRLSTLFFVSQSVKLLPAKYTAFMSRQSKVPLLLEVLLTRTLMMVVAAAVE